MLGRSIGNYQLTSKIGEGGMGVVYLAQHKTLGRRAAVKVLLPDLSSNQDIVSRFFNEARAATAVQNPGIVEVFDFGFLDDRCAYIVMEYLDGESLAARIRRGRSTVMATLVVLRAIARALQAAHDRGIVHRDLKPDNVFLVPDAELASGERVKLLDFGIAKLASGVSQTGHTRTGTVMGTPTYMAPEQCRGAGSVDHRADLYALGCVAYEMLCGQPPFVAEGAGDIIARHLYFEPQPPRAYRSDLRPEVEEFVLWLLRKDPAARPSTATDVVHAIDRLAAMAPTVALRSEPAPTPVTTPRPATMDTTLSGAASMSNLEGPASTLSRGRSMRVRIAMGATTGFIVLVVAIVWARSAHHDEPPDLTAGGDLSSSEHAGKPSDPPSSGRPATSSVAVRPSDDIDTPARPVVETRPGDITKTTDAAKTTDASGVATPVPPTDPVKSLSSTTTAEVPPTGKQPGSGKPTKPENAPVLVKSTRSRSAEGCTRHAFAAVLDAASPSEADVKAALAHLQRCKPSMERALHSDIQRQLIGKP